MPKPKIYFEEEIFKWFLLFLYILHNFPPFLVKVSINLTNTSILSFLNKTIVFINFFA